MNALVAEWEKILWKTLPEETVICFGMRWLGVTVRCMCVIDFVTRAYLQCSETCFPLAAPDLNRDRGREREGDGVRKRQMKEREERGGARVRLQRGLNSRNQKQRLKEGVADHYNHRLSTFFVLFCTYAFVWSQSMCISFCFTSLIFFLVEVWETEGALFFFGPLFFYLTLFLYFFCNFIHLAAWYLMSF